MANFRTKITQSNIRLNYNGETPTLLKCNGQALKQIRVNGEKINDYKIESNVRVNINLRIRQFTISSGTPYYNLSNRFIDLDGVSISDNSISGYNATTDISIVRYSLKFRYSGDATFSSTGEIQTMSAAATTGGDTCYLLSGSYIDVRINGVERRITLSSNQTVGADSYAFGDTSVAYYPSFSGVVSYSSV